MNKLQLSAYDLAQRFVGIKETKGALDNPAIMAMLKLDNSWPEHDEVAWCSAFVNYIAHLLRLPRSKALNARSWLKVGTPVPLVHADPKQGAQVGPDIVILNRGGSPSPDAEGPGHVGFYAGFDPVFGKVLVLGGNQGDSVGIARFDSKDVLGVRRLYS